MIKELRTQHRNIIQMSFSGFKNQEIAERLDMSQGTVSGILRSPLGQAYMGGLHDKSKENTLDVRKQLISMNTSALAAFERILSPSGKAPYNVQFSTAKDILDRNGFKPTDKINIDMTLQAKSDDEIDAEITALTNSIAAVAKATGDSSDIETNETNETNEVEEESSESLLLNPSTKAITDSLSDLPHISEDSSSTLNMRAEQSPELDELTKTSIDNFPPK